MNEDIERRKWVTTMSVTLPTRESRTDAEGGDAFFSPPSVVLDVSVVAELAFLSVNDYTEDFDSSTRRATSQVSVDAEALLSALVSQMPVERVSLIVAGQAR